MYKQLYEIELKTSQMKDSLYNICMNKPERVIEVVKKETNWLITTGAVLVALLLNWTIYLTLNK